jgi:hypothetical protein
MSTLKNAWVMYPLAALLLMMVFTTSNFYRSNATKNCLKATPPFIPKLVLGFLLVVLGIVLGLGAKALLDRIGDSSPAQKIPSSSVVPSTSSTHPLTEVHPTKAFSTQADSKVQPTDFYNVRCSDEHANTVMYFDPISDGITIILASFTGFMLHKCVLAGFRGLGWSCLGLRATVPIENLAEVAPITEGASSVPLVTEMLPGTPEPVAQASYLSVGVGPDHLEGPAAVALRMEKEVTRNSIVQQLVIVVST